MLCKSILVFLSNLITQVLSISSVVVNNHLVETSPMRDRIKFPTPFIHDHIMSQVAALMPHQTLPTKPPEGHINQLEISNDYKRLLNFHHDRDSTPFRNFDEYLMAKNNFEQQLTTSYPSIGSNNYFDYLINLQNQNQNKNYNQHNGHNEYQFPEQPTVFYPVDRNHTIQKYYPLINSLNNHYLHQPITLSSASIEDSMDEPEYSTLYPSTTPLNEIFVEVPKRRPTTRRPFVTHGTYGSSSPTTKKYQPMPSITILSPPTEASIHSSTQEPILITIHTNRTQSTISPVSTINSNTVSIITVTPSPKKKKKKKQKPRTTSTSEMQKSNIVIRPPRTTATPPQNKNPIRIFHNYFIMNCSVLAQDTAKLKQLLANHSTLVAGGTVAETPEYAAMPVDPYTNMPTSLVQFYHGQQNDLGFASTAAPSKKPKQKQKIVYIDPPGVGEIKNVMDSVYGYMEEAFTDEKVVTGEERTVSKKKPKIPNFESRVGDSSETFDLPAEGPDSPTASGLSKVLLKRNYHVGTVDDTSEEIPGHNTEITVERTTRKPVTFKVTPAGDSRLQKEKMTTTIHVTSEYVTPTMSSIIPLSAPPKRPSSEDSDSDEYDDYSDSEEDDNESDDDEDDGDSDESGEEDGGEKDESVDYEDYQSITFDYTDDDSSKEDDAIFEFGSSSSSIEEYDDDILDYDGSPISKTSDGEQLKEGKANKKKTKKKIKKKTKKKKTKKKKKKTKAKKKKVPTKDSMEDYEDEYTSDFLGMIGKFFTAIGRYMPFFGPVKKKVKDEDEGRSTTPRIDFLRKPKKPSFYDTDFEDLEENPNEEKQASPWYYPSFIYYNNYENDLLTPSSNIATLTVPTTTESGWFDPWYPWSSWFDADETNIITSSSEAATTTEDDTLGWFPSLNLFGDSSTVAPTTTSTTTTAQPPPANIPFLTISNPIKNPDKWLSILAQQLKVTTTTARPTPESANVPPKPVKVYYDNYQLWRLFPKSRENVGYVDDYRRSPEGQKLNWWRGPSLRGATDVLVQPSMLEIFKDILDDESITFEVVIRDLQKVIDYENPRISKREQIENEAIQGHPMTFYRYHRYADMLKYLDHIQRKYSKYVELLHIGRSYEGRPLIVVKLTFPSPEDSAAMGGSTKADNYRIASERKKKRSEKPAIFIEAGAHGREWISPASSLWIIDKLLKMIGSNETSFETVQAVDWYIMPVLNPDGYEFSHQFDRMWHKTRSLHNEKPTGIINTALNWLQQQPSSKEAEPTCFGVDPNRNWDFQWNQGTSSSSYECSNFYAGPKVFSEPETKALSKLLMEHRKEIKIYLALHSYGQLITYPNTDPTDETSYQQDELFDMAKVAVEALRGSGSPSRYIIDSSNELLYTHTSGASDAFAVNKIGIKYSYTIELRDTGTHGFLLPSSYIESSAQEAFEIIKGMIDYI